MASVTLLDNSLIVAGVWPVRAKNNGSVTVFGDSSSSDGGNTTAPTFYAWVTGTVTKFDEPTTVRVTAFSLEDPPKLLGSALSDPDTGQYSIDVAPHTAEVLVVAAPLYGREFVAGFAVAEGQIIHPTLPNRRVYKCMNTGALGGTEPLWPQVGQITSGDVTLEAVPLFEPLAGGFLKPTVVQK